MEQIEIDVEKTGAFISTLRKKLNMTQADLGEAVHVSRKAISKWEAGSTLPSIEMLPLLANVLGVTVDELIKGEYNSNKSEIKSAMSPYKLNRIILSSITLLALFFMFIFWASTFNKIRIYSIFSTNSQMKGNYIVAKDKRIFNISEIKVIDNSITDTKYYDVQYKVKMDDEIILSYGDISNFNKTKNNELKDLKKYVEDISIYLIDDVPNLGTANKNDYSLEVKYIDENYKEKKYVLEFKMSEFFANNKLFYEKNEI